MDSDVKGIEEHSKSLGKVCQLRFFDDFLLTTHRNALCGLVKLWDTITGEMLVGLLSIMVDWILSLPYLFLYLYLSVPSQSTICRHQPPQRDLHLQVLVPLRFRFPRSIKEEEEEEEEEEEAEKSTRRDSKPKAGSEIVVVSASEEVRVHLVRPASTEGARSVFTHRFSSAPTVATAAWGDSLFVAVAEDGHGAVYRCVRAEGRFLFIRV